MSILLVDYWYTMWNAIFDDIKHEIRKEHIPSHLHENGIGSWPDPFSGGHEKCGLGIRLVIQWYTIMQHGDIFNSFQVPQENLGSHTCPNSMYQGAPLSFWVPANEARCTRWQGWYSNQMMQAARVQKYQIRQQQLEGAATEREWSKYETDYRIISNNSYKLALWFD